MKIKDLIEVLQTAEKEFIKKHGGDDAYVWDIPAYDIGCDMEMQLCDKPSVLSGGICKAEITEEFIVHTIYEDNELSDRFIEFKGRSL